MNDKIYELLNNAEINMDEYEQIPLSDHETRKIKNRFLKENAKMRNRSSRKKIAVAVAAVAICSVTVTAGAAIRSGLVEKQQNGNVLTVGMNTDDEQTVAGISFAYDYVPEGYSEWQENYFSKDGEYGGKGFWVRQSAGGDNTFEYLEKATETTINGKKAYCYEMGEENRDVQNVILVEYNEEGIIYGLYSDDISMEELLRVAEGITVTKTGDTIDLNRDGELFYDGSYIKIPEKQIVSAEEPIIYPEGYENKKGSTGELGSIRLKSVEITDSVAGLEPEYFQDYEEEIAPFINEDGSFKPYMKWYDVYSDDGVTRESEECGFYVVRAKFELTNTTDRKTEFWVGAAALRCLQESDEGWYDYETLADYNDMNTAPGTTNAGDASYFDQPQHVSGDDRSQYFYVDLEAGETIEYEMAYIVYDDIDMNDLYLEVAPFGMSLDISNFGTEYPDNVAAWYWKVR